MFYEEYEPEVLKKLQMTELEMLHDFNLLAEKYDIDFFACGGTAIGAMRHKGFIPWDDDIDIGLDRKNYDLLLDAYEKEFGNKYIIINADNYSEYPLMTTRIVKRGTKYIEHIFKNYSEIPFGIFLDIYCFDNIPDNIFLRYWMGLRAWFYNKLMIIKAVEEPTLYFGGFKKCLVLTICKIIHLFLNGIKVSNKGMYNKTKKIVTRYKNDKTEYIGYLFDPTPFTSTVKREDIFPSRKTKFEDIQINVPKNIDEYLIPRYGDYMKMPPEDKRHNHKPYILDFGD